MKYADFDPNRLKQMIQSGRDPTDLSSQRKMRSKRSFIQHESSLTEASCERLDQKIQ